MTRSSAGLSRRGRNGQRTHKITVRLSGPELATVKAAASSTGMAPGAWIGQTAMDAAELRAAPVPELHRSLLVELTRASALLERALAGGAGQAEAACARAADRVDAAALRVARLLRQ